MDPSSDETAPAAAVARHRLVGCEWLVREVMDCMGGTSGEAGLPRDERSEFSEPTSEQAAQWFTASADEVSLAGVLATCTDRSCREPAAAEEDEEEDSFEGVVRVPEEDE